MVLLAAQSPHQDSTAVFTAARDIEAGEQLFISYIDASQVRSQAPAAFPDAAKMSRGTDPLGTHTCD